MSDLEQTAQRILDKADKAARTGDLREATRLELLAECLWPSDPVQREVDRLEREEVEARYSSRPHKIDWDARHLELLRAYHAPFDQQASPNPNCRTDSTLGPGILDSGYAKAPHAQGT